jgi:hypothetical protein
MKNIITIIALLIATASFAQTTTTTADQKSNETTKTVEVKDAKATTPATKDATAKYDDDSSQFVGTNDFYLVLVREGVKKG